MGLDLTDRAVVTRALQAFEEQRRPHTARQSQTAYFLGQPFHHAPTFAAPIGDLIFDRTPFLQKLIGEATPGEIMKQFDQIDAAELDFVSSTGRSRD